MLPALSPSRASDFMTCPMLYRFRVIDKLPSPPTAATARGTLVHAVLERLFDLPTSERTLDAAVALVPREWERIATEEPEMLSLLAEHDGRTDEWFSGAGALLQTWFG
ncbi:PD-(D/E)XK nuclease family protein, partial [Intrasporangium sp.]|uniref:RecB family exonuclease n=1 Tax=Intrasporangium sp. TaxID=1925024 RepID=UPI003365B12F